MGSFKKLFWVVALPARADSKQPLELRKRGVWIPRRLQSYNRAGYLVGGLKPGRGLHPLLALGEEREPPGLGVLSLALSQWH